jgi:hypothetical protein
MLKKRQKLPRLPMRPEKEPGANQPLWHPDWRCFCCHDTGIVRDHLAAMVIDSYDHRRDKLPLCQNPGCQASHQLGNLFDCLDTRLSPAICQELDMEEREDWQQTLAQQQHRHLELRKLAQKMSMSEK